MSSARCIAAGAPSFSTRFRSTKDDGKFGHVYKARETCSGWMCDVEGGHSPVLFAEICGLTGSSCLPRYYNTFYQHGRVVQYIDAAPPPCDYACVDERSGAPACCTGACEVRAVWCAS